MKEIKFCPPATFGIIRDIAEPETESEKKLVAQIPAEILEFGINDNYSIQQFIDSNEGYNLLQQYYKAHRNLLKGRVISSINEQDVYTDIITKIELSVENNIGFSFLKSGHRNTLFSLINYEATNEILRKGNDKKEISEVVNYAISKLLYGIAGYIILEEFKAKKEALKVDSLYYYRTLIWKLENFVINSDAYLSTIEQKLPYQNQVEMLERLQDYYLKSVLENEKIDLITLIHKAKIQVQNLLYNNAGGAELFKKEIQSSIGKLFEQIKHIENNYHLGLANDVENRGFIFREIQTHFKGFYQWLQERGIIEPNKTEPLANITQPLKVDKPIAIIHTIRQSDFCEIEIKLIEQNYLDSELKWLCQQQDLVVLIEILIDKKYFRKTINGKTLKPSEIRTFFCERYNTTIGDMHKLSKLNGEKRSALKMQYFFLTA